MNFDSATPREQRFDAPEQQASSSCAGVINTPCGAPRCLANSIEPEDFLSECIAPVCWDCWFVSQKIQL